MADILAEAYDEPYIEYGLIGLATQSNPFNVIATPVLTGQHVTAGSVYQSGYNVFRLRREMRILSERLGQSLVPITFIHRHPGSCGMSLTDEKFLMGPFVDQVSTVVALSEKKVIQVDDFNCHCKGLERITQHNPNDNVKHHSVTIEYSVCFSIIVNREREFSIDAACKQFCPFCKKSTVRLVPAALHINPGDQLTKAKLGKLRSQLEVEIEAKLDFEQSVKTE
jgi:hypothetical protein